MDSRKLGTGISNSGGAMCWPNSFLCQPARVLVMDAMPPWWSETCTTFCEALDNFLSLACSLDGPCRIPLLSIYAVSRQQECLLPFVQVRGNLGRLRSCVEELRSIPDEGCIRGADKAAELLRQAVLDSLQQFKQYSRHINSNAPIAGSHATSNASVEVTVVTSQPGRGVVKWLEAGLKGADLVSLRRLLVVHVSTAEGEWTQGTPSPENTQTGTEDNLMLGTEVDLQQVDNTVVAMETMLKAWLHEQGGDREHLHLLLPSSNLDGTSAPVCVKCDMQECLLSPVLFPVTPNLAVNTESVCDFQPATKSNRSPAPQTLRAIKLVRADAVCESVLYGLPLVIRPTNCWRLDWDDMEMNHNLFHALCHMLRSREVFLLVQVEPVHTSTAAGPGVYSYYILQSSDSLTLLLKPVVSRELLLPFSVPVSNVDPQPDALQLIQGCLGQLDEEFLFNPLSLKCNLYQHLRNRALLSRSVYPYRLQQSAPRDQPQPPVDGTKTKQTRQPRQAQSQGRQLGAKSRVRATIAPLPQPSSSTGPPPNKASRPTLTFLGGSHRSPMSSPYPPLWKGRQDEDEDDDNDDSMRL